MVSGLHTWFLPWPERRGTALGLSSGAEWWKMRQGHPAAVPRAWPPRAGTAPGPPGHRDCLGDSTPKTLLRGMLAGGTADGAGHGGATSPPCHSVTSRHRSSHNAPGSIKGAASPVPLPELVRGQPEDIPEEILEETVELLRGGEGGRPEAGRGCWRDDVQSSSDGWKSFSAG